MTTANGTAQAVDLAPTKGVSATQVGVVFACTVGNIFGPTAIVYACFGLFLIPITTDFAWSRAQVSGVLGPVALLTAIVYPTMGRLTDRFGSRGPILIGAAAFGLAVMALSATRPNLAQFYVQFALVGLFGACASAMMYSRVISGWFDRARGAMLGLALGLGNGVGATAIPVLALLLMSRFGWRGAYLGLGTLILLISCPVLFFLMKEPPPHEASDPGTLAEPPGLTLMQAARTLNFWMMLIAIALGAGCMNAVLAHVVPILLDRGFSVAQGTAVVSVFAMVTSGWQIAVGWLLDKTGSPRMVAPLYLTAVGGLLLLEHATSLPMQLVGGTLMGLGMGTEFGALSYFVSRYFGLKRFGLIIGVMYSAVALGLGVIPYLMDVDFDAHKTYLLSLHVIDAAMTLGGLVLAGLPPYQTIAARWSQPAHG